MNAKVKIRLFIGEPLAAECVLPLDANQAHYLFGVMRQQVGGQVRLFNGVDGEWQAEIVQAGKRKGLLKCTHQTGPQVQPPDLWLAFAPVKKVRTALIVEKAVEMGVSRLVPIITRFTNERFNTDRMRSHAIEAAEQCGATFVPPVDAPLHFDKLVDSIKGNRQIMFCDESRTASPVSNALKQKHFGPWAIFIGPEGGFSEEESRTLLNTEKTTPVSLGPRILRADTAVVAAITAWQQALGDWK